MVVGIGIDLIVAARIERAVAHQGPDLLDELFTAPERAACRGARRPWPRYAAMFAAKEACFKALGTGKIGVLAWTDIEVTLVPPRAVSVALRGEAARVAADQQVSGVHASVALTRDSAVAWVVLTGDVIVIKAARNAAGESPMKETILDYIRHEYLDGEDDTVLDEHTPLISSGIVDSFSMVSLKRFLEKKNGIRIPDDEATPQAFDTVASMMALVDRLLAKKGA